MNNIHKLLSTAALLIIGTGAWAQTGKPSIGGNVFGGGRMADVNNTSEAVTAIIDVYASTITGGVFGGNDITGKVNSATGDANASAKITIHDKCDAAKGGTSVGEVYGGGNGYYKYKIGDTTIEIGNITDTNKNTTVAAGTEVTVLDASGNTVTTFTTAAETTYGGLLPTLGSTNVIVGDGTGTTPDAADKNNIRLNEVYGGAKNAYVTGTSGVTVYSGTIAKVFAGNNYGGTATSSSLTINGTKTPTGDARDATAFKAMTDANWALVGDITTTDGDGNYSGYGIGEAYGGGNAVDVLGTATVTVNGGYVKTLFGGNNLADMQGVPSISFGKTSNIYIQNVYGGGNAGDMKGGKGMLMDCANYYNPDLFSSLTNFSSSKVPFFVGTDIQLTSNTLFVNNVYGGCRSANVDNSTLVNIKVESDGGYIGTVYGGSDIAGSIGYNPGTVDATQSPVTFTKYDHSSTESIAYTGYMLYAASDISMTAGTVENIFGGGNGVEYETYKAAKIAASETYKDEPWVVSTTVGLFGGTVTGNVYTGGNKATVGHVLTEAKTYYGTSYESGKTLEGISYLVIGAADGATSSTTVQGAAYGGGRMADVHSTVDIYVKDGVNITQLFAGNDISGTVDGTVRGYQRNPAITITASTMLKSENSTDAKLTFDGTSLLTSKPPIYVRIEDGATIGTLFGGGNGDYDYTTGDYSGLTAPKVTSSWLDIKGKIGTVYGGGNAADIDNTNVCVYGAAVIGKAAVAASGTEGEDGYVAAQAAVLGAVYGGCKSANVTRITNVIVEDNSKNSVDGTTTLTPTINGNVFGGCDISGNVGNCSYHTCDGGNADYHLDITNVNANVDYARVDIQAGKVTGRVFGGGNGLQDAAGTAYYIVDDADAAKGLTVTSGIYSYPEGSTYAGKLLPQVQNTWVTVKNATIGTSPFAEYTHTLFSGGQGMGTRVWHNAYTVVGEASLDAAKTIIDGTVYGGSYAGIVNTSCDDCTKVDLTSGTVTGDVYGGSYGNDVNGKITLTVASTASIIKGTYGSESTSFGGGVYAANNAAGQPKCEVTINYAGNEGCQNTLYGGGKKAVYYGNTHIVFTNGNIGYIYGGGEEAAVYGNTLVEVLGGYVCHDVFGGGYQGNVEDNPNTKDVVEGNTTVIIRNDCLKLGADSNGVEPGGTGYIPTFAKDGTNYVANRDASGNLTPNTENLLSTIEIGGNVYGGGNQAPVKGRTTVQIGNDCTK